MYAIRLGGDIYVPSVPLDEGRRWVGPDKALKFTTFADAEAWRVEHGGEGEVVDIGGGNAWPPEPPRVEAKVSDGDVFAVQVIDGAGDVKTVMQTPDRELAREVHAKMRQGGLVAWTALTPATNGTHKGA